MYNRGIRWYKMAEEEALTIYRGPMRVWVSGPSIVEPNERFDIKVSLLRLDGYLATNYEGELIVEGGNGIEGLPDTLIFSKDDCGIKVLDNCRVPYEGIFRFEISPSKGFFPTGCCHPIWAVKRPEYRLFWGDVHVHSVLGRCGSPYLPKSPDFGYWFARDILGHDFCSITDHASLLTDDAWEKIRSSLKRWHSPGRFVTILGFETDYDGEDGGHFNIYFPTDNGYFKNFKMEAGGTLNSIFDFTLSSRGIAVCHHTSRVVCGRDFSKSRFGGLEIEPVMEIYSQWGSSEEYESSRPTIEGRHPSPSHYYRYALKHGFKLGVIGGSDSHCTTPGGSVPMVYPRWGGKQLFPYPGGVAAIYTNELTRKGLFDALRARRCYATSLEKILIWIEAEGMPMGSEIESSKVEIDILVSCTYPPLREVVIVKNGRVAARFGKFGKDEGFDSSKRTFRLTWRDKDFNGESSYYVRAIQFDGDLAWSSPIWIRPK